LGRALTGTLETVGGLTRETIKTYRDRHYFPGLITVAAAGDIDHPSLVKIAEAHFGGIRNQKPKDLSLFVNGATRPKLKILEKKTEQTHLALGLHAFSKEHRDEHALDILSVLLGGNMSSRLFNEVREERGLAYDIGSSVRKYHDTGAFVVSAGVDNSKLVDAMELILKELEKAARQKATPDELGRSKEFYLGQMDLGLENSMSNMLWVGESAVTLGRCRTVEEITAGVEAVTAEDLRRVAEDLFTKRPFHLCIVGPGVPDASRKRLEKLLSGKTS